MAVQHAEVKLEDDIKPDLNKIKIKIEHEERKDPTSFLPEEPMVYQLKKKKKKKRHQEDPFKDIGERAPVQVIKDYQPDDLIPALDPEVNIKVENIEVELDINDFAENGDLLLEGPNNEDSQEPAVKIEQQNREAVILTFESVINDKTILGYTQEVALEPAPNHVCKVCHLVFQSQRTLRMHQKRKHKVFRRSFKHICDYCGMSYETKNSLVAHIKRKHGPDSVPDDTEERTCEICALVFKGLTRLRMHMRRKHGLLEESFKHECQDCGLTYDKYSSLVVHVQRKHSKIPKPVSMQWFKCPFCPKIFSKRETYARHVQRKHRLTDDSEEDITEETLESCINKATGEITCKECSLVFSSLNFLKLHMRRKHNALKEDFRLKCMICNLSYDKIESLKRHVRRKHDNGAYCDVCNKEFGTRESYLSHSHVKVIKECSICGLIFASQAGLSKHLRCTHKMDTPKTVFCNICNAGFHDKRQLKPHLLKVHLKVSYTCRYCTKVFKARESYRRHILFKHPTQAQTKSELQSCDQCPDTFLDEVELSRHVRLAHPKKLESDQPLVEIKKEECDVKQFQCTKCPENYQVWEQLRLHYEQNHHTVQDTQCQICGQILPANELAKHIKQSHTADPVLECKYCGEFKTTIKASMTQHLLRHKNASTIRCEYPGCRFKSFYEDAMSKHKKKHVDQGVKLQCSKCPFQTMNKYILRYHEEAHETGKKRYTCDQCDYATILPANLVQHKYKHSTEKRFKCEFCPFATKYNTSLRFHVKKKHCDLPILS